MLTKHTYPRKEKFINLLFCLFFFMGVRFGAYEKTYSTDFDASISVVSVACAVPAFIMRFIITLGQPLFFKGSMYLDSYYHNRFLATLVGCLRHGRRGSCLLVG